MAESILHFGAIRLRVNGTGILRMTLIGLDSVKTKTIAPYTMSLTPGREPTVLTNFNAQRARLRMQTTAIDEYMKVNRAILYVNQYAEEFPR
jgi:hypothetical protein